MPASLTFCTDSKKEKEASTDLSDAKVIVYKDNENNKYTLDVSGEQPSLKYTNHDNVDTDFTNIFLSALRGPASNQASCSP